MSLAKQTVVYGAVYADYVAPSDSKDVVVYQKSFGGGISLYIYCNDENRDSCPFTVSGNKVTVYSSGRETVYNYSNTILAIGDDHYK